MDPQNHIHESPCLRHTLVYWKCKISPNVDFCPTCGPCCGCRGYIKVIPRSIQVHTIGARRPHVQFIPWSALFKYFKMRYYMSKIGNLLNFTRLLSHRGPCYGCGGYIKVISRSIQVHTMVCTLQILQMRYYMPKIGNLSCLLNFTCFLSHRGPCYGCGGYIKVISRSIQVHTMVCTLQILQMRYNIPKIGNLSNFTQNGVFVPQWSML